jgi:hypothetical protein
MQELEQKGKRKKAKEYVQEKEQGWEYKFE